MIYQDEINKVLEWFQHETISRKEAIRSLCKIEERYIEKYIEGYATKNKLNEELQFAVSVALDKILEKE